MTEAALTREAAHLRRRTRKTPPRLSLAYGGWPECLIGAPAGPDFDPAEFHPFTPEQIAAGLVIPVFLPKERS